jgi:hypothetical protein
MKRLLLALCAIACIFAATAPCFADATYGVLAEERVINLPSDQGKWYISVVGDAANPQYQTIIKWFDTNAHLKNLKNRVHFCPVTTDSAVYRERYASNVKGLPTVRFQQPNGIVIYEAAGTNLPFTAEGLYGAMANSIDKAQGRPILPWRRNHVHPCPCPGPQPDPSPGPVDPEPQPLDPPVDPVEPPIDTQSDLPPVWLMALVLVLSAGLGIGMQWRETYAKK